ncbi:MAG: FAD-dependent oxidoreductase [Firmicutes bacterium]|nr:FAD-dependent oxidoreductase [Bacillota bacterium]
MITKTKDIVIYGAGFAGCAATLKAATTAPNKTIALIVTDPIKIDPDSTLRVPLDDGKALGGIGTIGGQNYWDRRTWGGNVQKSSFEYWYNLFGQAYSTEEMSQELVDEITAYSNVEVFYAYDIYDFDTATSPYRITAIYLKGIERQTTSQRRVIFDLYCENIKINGTVFIDASEDGKLTRSVNFGGTTGRYDWPAGKLDSSEQGTNGKPRQQAATLMFKIKGFDPSVIENTSDTGVTLSKSGGVLYSAYGGTKQYKENSTIIDFNDEYGPTGFALKPFNMGVDVRNGTNRKNWEWWINCFLVFNVDGRACYRDDSNSVNSNIYPQDKRSDYYTTDEGWKRAYNFLNNSTKGTALLNAIRQFPGFADVEYVKENNKVVVGEVLYLRETVHMAINSQNRANGTEDTNYQLGAMESYWSGEIPTGGYDSGNYTTRIGLGYYYTDINAYKYEDLKRPVPGSDDPDDMEYIWDYDIAQKLRADTWPSGENPKTPHNPVYIPYKALTTNYVANLLIPGYAVGASSFAWAELRVLPNLCVLGDAAGVAAAYAVNNGIHPLQFTSTHITAVQNLLVNTHLARLEK